MPYPAQITTETILDAADVMIAAEGADALSLNKLASALGVKAPSLYRYFDSKTALLRALNERTLHALVKVMHVPDGGDPAKRMRAIFHAYRAFAHQHPLAYGLLFTNTISDIAPDAALSEALVLPLQNLMAQVSGEARSLEALRGALALAHGFVTLEICGQFRRGGDLDAAFDAAITAYIHGWSSSA